MAILLLTIMPSRITYISRFFFFTTFSGAREIKIYSYQGGKANNSRMLRAITTFVTNEIFYDPNLEVR